MDANLDQRWTEGRAPFDGYTLVFDESLHKVVGTAVVRFLLAELDARFGIGEKVYVNEDWHVHDGYVKESQTVSKADLLSELETHPEKWIRVIDYQVYWGIYDRSARFYLRFGLEEDDSRILSIDLTSDEETVRALGSKVRSALHVEFETMEAKAFFDRIYGG